MRIGNTYPSLGLAACGAAELQPCTNRGLSVRSRPRLVEWRRDKQGADPDAHEGKLKRQKEQGQPADWKGESLSHCEKPYDLTANSYLNILWITSD
jgi:hypothetical protein